MVDAGSWLPRRSAVWSPIERLSALLLVDERATHAEVSQAILGVLEAAHEDDVVVVSFAGHGTTEDVDALDSETLTKCAGEIASALLRPKRGVVSDAASAI